MRYRFYEDLYNNEYRWSTERSDTDGKFVACIYKYKTYGNMGTRYVLSKERRFNQRQMAKAWCLKNCRKAKEHQEVVLRARTDRKTEREALKPVYTKTQLKLRKLLKTVNQLNANIKRADTKLKSVTTRRRTYEKKVKTTMRQIQKMEEL